MYEDNTACIKRINNVIGGRERAKHIDIRKHFAHEAAQLGHLGLYRVSTAEHVANVFTESLQAKQRAACSDPQTLEAVVARDVGPHEGKRHSQRKQSESILILTRSVSQSREFRDRVQY